VRNPNLKPENSGSPGLASPNLSLGSPYATPATAGGKRKLADMDDSFGLLKMARLEERTEEEGEAEEEDEDTVSERTGGDFRALVGRFLRR
jgi:hypothetical protein